ncbi:MAG: ferritin [Candidatus Omnitrophica bacterium]|nr:ferritin [Candidatus Omnitrophota bacterium]
MLSKKIQTALNNQILEETYASHYYLSMASWCDQSGLHGSAQFFYRHSQTEKDHMLKLFRYVNDAGGHALVAAVKEPPRQFKSLAQVFELTLEHERHVTKSINALVETCLADKDYSTFNFLQWYVAEQHEEERLFQYILDLIKITGLEGRGLFLIDREIAKLPESAAAKNS